MYVIIHLIGKYFQLLIANKFQIKTESMILECNSMIFHRIKQTNYFLFIPALLPHILSTGEMSVTFQKET